MTFRRKARVTGEKYTDIRLWKTATYLLGIGESRTRGQFHPLLAASVFAFFAFEAYLNEVGCRLDPDVWKRERTFFARGRYQGTLGKFRYLAVKVHYKYRPGARPFQTVRELAAVRDALAHGRTHSFDLLVDDDRANRAAPKAQFEKWGTLPLAKRAVADVEKLADGLMAASKGMHGQWAAGHRSSGFTGVTGVSGIHLET